MDTHKTLIAKACSICGSQANLARAIDLSPAMVNQLIKGVRPVPMEHCAAIGHATGGLVERWDFFPNDWYRIWPELIGIEGAPEVFAGPAPTPTDPATPSVEVQGA